MKKNILNFAYYAFYVLFIFFCFQTAHIELKRDDSGMVQANLTREHFWGLIQFHKTINNVKGAGVNYVERTSARERITSVVSIYSETNELPVFLGSCYEYGNNVQEDIVKQVNSFVHNTSAPDSSGRHKVGKIFPWLIFIFIAAHLWNDLGLNDWYIRVRKRNMLKIAENNNAQDPPRANTLT